MKVSRVVWFVLGGLALAVLGFAVGFLTRSGGFGLHRGFIGGAFPLLMGFGLLAHLIGWLGPIAGIVALIVVLSRRNNSVPTPPPAQPAASAPASEETAANDSTPPMPTKKKQS